TSGTVHPSPRPTGAVGMLAYMVKFFQDGGNIMFVNLLVLGYAVAVVAERLVVLSRMRLKEKEFLAEVETFVNAGNFDRAIKLCTEYPRSVAAKIVKSALSAARLGGSGVASAIDESM